VAFAAGDGQRAGAGHAAEVEQVVPVAALEADVGEPAGVDGLDPRQAPEVDHEVAGGEPDGVRAGAAVDDVPALVAADQEGVVAAAAGHDVVAVAADDDVVADPAVQGVVAFAARQLPVLDVGYGEAVVARRAGPV